MSIEKNMLIFFTICGGLLFIPFFILCILVQTGDVTAPKPSYYTCICYQGFQNVLTNETQCCITNSTICVPATFLANDRFDSSGKFIFSATIIIGIISLSGVMAWISNGNENPCNILFFYIPWFAITLTLGSLAISNVSARITC